MPELLHALTDPLPPALAEWLTTLLFAIGALIAAELLFRVGARVVRRATRPSPMASSVARTIHNPAQWALLIAGLAIVWEAAPAGLPMIGGVQRLTTQLLIAALTWLVIAAVRGVADAVIEAHPLTGSDILHARRVQTQTRVLARTFDSVVLLVGISLMLMTFPAVRQIGASLLASAGVLGIIAGLAARPVLGNMIAGLQIGLSQPIRLDDVVIVQGEWGVIEAITSTYVVVRIWDQRRLVVPLQWWIENPFQNWTLNSTDLTGTVFLWVDYRMPLEPLRAELQRACEATPLWDGRLTKLQVFEAGDRAIQLRCLVTATSAPTAWDLRCHVREWLIDFMQREYPQFLPTQRGELRIADPDPVPARPGT